MFTELTGYPLGVIAIRGTGNITANDYREVLVPAIARAADGGHPVRLLLILGLAFEGYDPSALLADTQLGARSWRSFDRIAIVTDAEWLQVAVRLLGPLIPGEVKVYPTQDEPVADAWIRSAA
jgi:hypothetical protein